MTRLRWFTLVIAVALVTSVWLALPPRAEHLTIPSDPLTARGAIHVHTVRSDGAGTPEQVASAAHRAGLDFVVLTDHGDGTRRPDPPRYVDGVLLIDAVEISTTAGHLLGLGISQAPYRLAGEPRDVLEDIHRLGGFGIAAHPDSPKPELRWRDWKANVDGLEWLNADSEWRDESRLALTRALVSYWFRPSETLGSLFDGPDTLGRWDRLLVNRPIVGVAGHDAHARIPLSPQADVSETTRSFALPSYEASFRALSQSVRLSAPLSHSSEGSAGDASKVLGALRAGSTYTVVDALAGPARLDFHGEIDGRRVEMGETVAGEHPLQLRAVVTPTIATASILLLENGNEVARSDAGAALDVTRPPEAGPTSYRIEVRRDGAPGSPQVPWIVGNAITVGLPARPPRTPEIFTSERAQLDDDSAPWTIERATTSEAQLGVAPDPAEEPSVHFSWHLASGQPSGQYAALAVPIRGADLARFTDLSITASSSRPMRLSVQIRIPEGHGLRWQRSIYLDRSPSSVHVVLRDMTPIEAPAGTPLDVAKADTLLFVVDTVNNTPGSAGELWITDVRWRLRCCRGGPEAAPHEH
jgi:hypothetical protein